ncbi:MAG: S-layer homology domain-containing protein [Clostridiaceae bacterium]
MMNKKIWAIFLIFLTCLLLPGAAFAREGICGYEGGISSGEVTGKTTYDYKEVCFVTGEPVVFEGTLIIKKSQKQGKTTATYTYNLKNAAKDATLSRTLVFETTTATADNGQITETVSIPFSKPATETIKIGGTTYTLRRTNGYDFARSSLIDPKPAVNYHAGSIWSKKIYQVGAADDGNTVTVECTGDFYGYDQYWGNAESLLLDYTISSEKNGSSGADKWGGAASVAISSTSTEQLEYQENKPDQISFSGSYVQSRANTSILEYTCMLPEFDSKGISTDKVITYKDSLKLETFPVQKRLPSMNTINIRGHWAEEDIKMMFGLEVFKGDGLSFKPDQYMTRAEFAAGMVQIAKEVPQDPALSARPTITASRTTAKKTVVSPFDDVSIENVFFTQINSAFDRGLLDGKGNDMFGPNEYISRADAIVTFIRALGFESLAPAPAAVTGFRDNDLIPDHARNAAYVAKKIGLLQGDGKGNMNPSKKLTKADCSAMFRDLITYLQDGIQKDYRERLVNY